ncbi:hypothetical protein AAFC00_000266 [Neodothiora populina]|uniref:Heme oxygenase-like protein n=1 Tax=Neodothiora populina TaxID=2781224 RepID=A0ABR3PCW2_9PEZI
MGGLSTPQSLLSPLPSPAPPSISTEINIATRGIHARLNKLIVSRLPLSVPPHSKDPRLYAYGISAFAQIYYAFEARWRHLCSSQEQENEEEKSTNSRSAASTHDAGLRPWLVELLPSGLWRSQAISTDLDHLKSILSLDLDPARNCDTLDKEMIYHVSEVTAAKPHVLVAYAWIMYMAIFSGGRWMRQQFVRAGPSFWDAGENHGASFGSPQTPVPGFSLFYFEGEEDGQDIKADFKARLELAERLLSAQERSDIVSEAKKIFEMCVELVGRLDEKLSTPA